MPWRGAFHSVAAPMLRSSAELVGLKPNVSTLDADAQLRLLKQIINAANIDEKSAPARLLAGLVDKWKNRGWTPADLSLDESHAYADGRGQEIYRADRKSTRLNSSH